MATTVTGAMSEFLSAIEPTTYQTAETSVSHLALRAYLRSELTVVSDFLTGSYARDTMLRQSRDVDVFLVLDINYYTGSYESPAYRDQATGPANLLDRIRRLLLNRYPNSTVSRDGQAVRVEFAHVHIDVVPAFVDLYSDGYLIPDSRSNSWLRSNPLKHSTAVSEFNARPQVGYRFVPISKMVKYWNYSHSYEMRGFFLEMWARDIYQFWSMDSHADGLHTFFDRAVYYLDAGYMVSDPAGYGDLMQQFLPTAEKRAEARWRLDSAREYARIAIDANGLGSNQLGISAWKSLFGTAFPAYG